MSDLGLILQEIRRLHVSSEISSAQKSLLKSRVLRLGDDGYLDWGQFMQEESALVTLAEKLTASYLTDLFASCADVNVNYDEDDFFTLNSLIGACMGLFMGKSDEELTLCELGCGSGKACFTALLTQNIHCVGIESDSALLHAGEILKEGLESHMEVLWGFQSPPEFVFTEGTIMQSAWWNTTADIYLCHTATWTPEEVKYLSDVCESELLPRETVVITFSVKLVSGDSSMVLIHSWNSGTATVYIYQKKDPVFINIPSPREKTRQHSSNMESSNNRNKTNEKKKEPRAFFPDTESDDEPSHREEDENDHRHPPINLPARPKTSRGRQNQKDTGELTGRPKTSRGPQYRRNN